METISTTDKPSTSKSKQIILSPEELKKLGLFRHPENLNNVGTVQATQNPKETNLEEFGLKLSKALNKKLRSFFPGKKQVVHSDNTCTLKKKDSKKLKTSPNFNKSSTKTSDTINVNASATCSEETVKKTPNILCNQSVKLSSENLKKILLDISSSKLEETCKSGESNVSQSPHEDSNLSLVRNQSTSLTQCCSPNIISNKSVCFTSEELKNLVCGSEIHNNMSRVLKNKSRGEIETNPTIPNEEENVDKAAIQTKDKLNNLSLRNVITEESVDDKVDEFGGLETKVNEAYTPIKQGSCGLKPENGNVSNNSHLEFQKTEDEYVSWKRIDDNEVSTSTPTQKRRGRPRRNQQEDNVSNAKSPQDKLMAKRNGSDSATPVDGQRKRGRPKKNQSLSIQSDENQSRSETFNDSEAYRDDELVLSSSKQGRKRKKINYLLMENPDLPPSQKKKTVSTNSVFEDNISNNKVEEKLTGDAKADNLAKSYMETDLQNQNTDGSNDQTDMLMPKSESKADVQNEKRKYHFTGKTVKMMAQVFANASQNVSTENIDNPEKKEENSVSVSRKRGRKPTKSVENQIIFNDDGTVICMACNLNIDNSEWGYHKRKIHYNLAWRKGETPLEIHEKTFVLKTLQDIKNTDKKLKCHKCGEKEETPQVFLEHLEICSGIVASSGEVTCAVCKESMDRSKWHFHKYRYHNNLAWREGEKPLDLNDQSLVVSILNGIYKAKKPLYCEKCGVKKKSVVGYLSHKSTCQKSIEELEDIKVACELCGKKILPVSMDYHLKVVHTKPDVQKKNARTATDSRPIGSKRKAAEQALSNIGKYNHSQPHEINKHYTFLLDFMDDNNAFNIIKKDLEEKGMAACKFSGCTFTDSTIESTLEHISNCNNKPLQYFTCRKCLLCTGSEEEIIKHVQVEHNVQIKEGQDGDFSINGQESDDDDETQINKRFAVERRKVKPRCLLSIINIPNGIFSEAYRWTLEFCEKNYSKIVFQSLADSEISFLDDDVINEYLPKNMTSCEVATKTIKYTDKKVPHDVLFQKMELFQSEEFDEGSSTVFCGGPVSALAWLPTPHNNSDCNQILAVSTLNDMDTKYMIDANYSEPSMIQFWDMGKLKNKEKPIGKPNFLFGLAHNAGPVWHLEWCPSGCYETFEDVEQKSRFGLLAVAASDSHVYIYSIPKLQDVGLFMKKKPVIRLEIQTDASNSLGKQRFYATRISWTKASGHNYISVGYTHGVVALFDLSTNSLLRRKDSSGIDTIFPCNMFQPHSFNITALVLGHLSGGNRWLITGSLDREVILWDLLNSTKVTSFKRESPSDVAWMTNWLAYFPSGDETVHNISTVHVTAKSVRDFLYEQTHLTRSNSSIKSISSSDWLNSIIEGNSVGEIICFFAKQLLHCVDCDKNLKTRRFLIGSSKLVDRRVPEIQESDNSKICASKKEPSNYKEAINQYKLLFVDYDMNKYPEYSKNRVDDYPGPVGKLEWSKPDLFSLQSINKIAFNPNLQASTFFVTGYQAGFLRLSWLKFLCKDRQVI